MTCPYVVGTALCLCSKLSISYSIKRYGRNISCRSLDQYRTPLKRTSSNNRAFRFFFELSRQFQPFRTKNPFWTGTTFISIGPSVATILDLIMLVSVALEQVVPITTSKRLILAENVNFVRGGKLCNLEKTK